MKQVTVVLMGMMLVLGMAWVPGSFAQIPGADLSMAITPNLSGECPPGKFNYNTARCMEEPKQPAAHSGAITPALSKCPGNFDYNSTRCR
ncbi:MAG TPA: hypothetical protein VLW47_07955 [Thermodesulfobacteriota bacterium]|nr:hypothetical protein [Thermodesulfobacteriota bacterium]